jgi:hypothetical protein
MEHEERADRLEREADKMEHESERVGDRIDRTRADWEAKEQDATVPGAQRDPDDQEDETVSEREESDQLPEEGPQEQVADDQGGAARDDAEESAGAAEGDERDTATGNPDAAGEQDPEDES